AGVYSNGESERILGKAIRQYKLPREEIVVLTSLWGAVSTKDVGDQLFGAPGFDGKGYANQYGLLQHIFHSVKNSLERLGLEYIDVLQGHRFDYNTPNEETVPLHDVVKTGWVRYIGMSSCLVSPKSVGSPLDSTLVATHSRHAGSFDFVNLGGMSFCK
ncbi:NADP-dependent oxidoreductase domain-containing protein, partial [Mucidula mucida]